MAKSNSDKKTGASEGLPQILRHHSSRHTAGQRVTPQVLVLQEAAELAPSENEPPETREAKVEIFLFTCELPHLGQVTSLMALALRTSSSKGR